MDNKPLTQNEIHSFFFGSKTKVSGKWLTDKKILVILEVEDVKDLNN